MADLWDRLEDSYDNLTDLRRYCRGCGDQVRYHLEDGYCTHCNSDEPKPWESYRRDMERAREATRRAEERANRKAGF